MTYTIMLYLQLVDNSPMITTTTRQTNVNGCELLFTFFQIMLMGPKSSRNCENVRWFTWMSATRFDELCSIKRGPESVVSVS